MLSRRCSPDLDRGGKCSLLGLRSGTIPKNIDLASRGTSRHGKTYYDGDMRFASQPDLQHEVTTREVGAGDPMKVFVQTPKRTE